MLQEQQISGKITDAEGQPIPGVSVLIKGTRLGTTSNFDGNYALKIPAEKKCINIL